jgi:hypothetical protein
VEKIPPFNVEEAIMDHPVTKLVEQWADAELRGDARAIEPLLADGFSFVGPAGFILDKQQWLGRFSERGLRYTSFRWTGLRVTDHDAVTIVVGVQEQEGDHQGRDISGRFRGTLVVIGADGGQRIAAMQLSPIMAPPGA